LVCTDQIIKIEYDHGLIIQSRSENETYKFITFGNRYIF